jgi:hypothetical protein
MQRKVEYGDFVIVKNAIAKKVEEVIGTISNISYPGKNKDFAYIRVMFLNNTERWYREDEVYTQKEKFIMWLVDLSVNKSSVKAMNVMRKLVKYHCLMNIYIPEPEETFVNGERMLIIEESPGAVHVKGVKPIKPKKEEEEMVKTCTLELDFENPVVEKEEVKPRFTRISDNMAVMLVGRVGNQKDFTLANAILFHKEKGLVVNNRLNKDIYDKTKTFLSLAVRLPRNDFFLLQKEVNRLYNEGEVYDFKSFDEVRSFIKDNKKVKK